MKEKPKIVFLDAGSVDLKDVKLDSLEKQGSLTLYSNSKASEIIQRSKEAEIIITNKCLIDKELFEQLPKLKLICAAATGVNHINLEQAKKHKIAVCNVKNYSTYSVAEKTFLFLLNLSHRFLEHDQYVKNKSWCYSPHFAGLDFPFSELKGKTLGIMGYGNIGKQVSKIAKAFGMKVLIAKLPGRTYLKSKTTRHNLNSVLKHSDFISLHCSLSSHTYHLINSSRLKLMKKTAFLLNLGRGDLINEKDLSLALKQNKLSGYASDVLSQEPPNTDNPLLKKNIQKKILLTPHVAWASKEARQLLINEMALNIEAFKKGKKRNRV